MKAFQQSNPDALSDPLAEEIIETFLQDMPHRMAALTEAEISRDAALIQRQAHTIKGAAANVGAPALRDIAFQVEEAAKHGDIENVVTLIPALEDALETLMKVIV